MENGKLIWDNKVKWNHVRSWKVQHLSAAFSSLVFLPRYYSPNQPFFSVFMHILVLKGDNSESTTSKKTFGRKAPGFSPRPSTKITLQKSYL